MARKRSNLLAVKLTFAIRINNMHTPVSVVTT